MQALAGRLLAPDLLPASLLPAGDSAASRSAALLAVCCYAGRAREETQEMQMADLLASGSSAALQAMPPASLGLAPEPAAWAAVQLLPRLAAAWLLLLSAAPGELSSAM